MSEYYKPKRGSAYNYKGSNWKLSRSKIDLFTNCPRCFYIDNKLGTKRPPGFPFNLNSAVDFLLKKEFDIHRAKRTTHPLMETYGLDAVPFDHPDINIWRENFKGLQYKHPKTGFLITGAVDDVWVNPSGELLVVDYKSTSKEGEVTIDAPWQDGYKRQMEVYQWLLRQMGFMVSDTGYFVYVNGRTDVAAFDGKLEFDVKLISYTGKDDWVEKTLDDILKCLEGDLPDPSPNCDYCGYVQAVFDVTKQKKETEPIRKTGNGKLF
jgi:CRISPR/Cas system-associated exonuclease Cas4 (RecB family)